MRSDRRPIRPANAATLATTASALVALVAVAATMSSLPGASVRTALLESRVAPVEAPSVRAVAAAVVAAARELAGNGGAERFTALPADLFAHVSIAPAPPIDPRGADAVAELRSRSLPERLIDLPPPIC